MKSLIAHRFTTALLRGITLGILLFIGWYARILQLEALECGGDTQAKMLMRRNLPEVLCPPEFETCDADQSTDFFDGMHHLTYPHIFGSCLPGTKITLHPNFFAISTMRFRTLDRPSEVERFYSALVGPSFEPNRYGCRDDVDRVEYTADRRPNGLTMVMVRSYSVNC